MVEESQTVMVEKKEAGENTTIGTAKFDENGKMELPNGKVLTEAKVKADVKKHTKPKAVKDPKLLRTNVVERDEFIATALKEIKGLKKVDVTVRDSTEPVLKYNNRMVCWCSPRANMLWGNYLYPVSGQKEIIKITNDKEAETLLTRIKGICKDIDNLPSKKVKAVKAGKKPRKKGKKNAKPRTLEDVQEQIANLGKKANAVHVKEKTTIKGLIEWAEEQGYKWTGDDGCTLMVRQIEDN